MANGRGKASPKKANKSKPVGYKQQATTVGPYGLVATGSLANKKGGKQMTKASKVRGGYGAARPNFGGAARKTGLRPVGGRGK